MLPQFNDYERFAPGTGDSRLRSIKGWPPKWLVDLYEAVGNFSAVIIGDSGDGAFYLLHEARKIIARTGDRSYADGGALPQIGLFQFGN